MLIPSGTEPPPYCTGLYSTRPKRPCGRARQLSGPQIQQRYSHVEFQAHFAFSAADMNSPTPPVLRSFSSCRKENLPFAFLHDRKCGSDLQVCMNCLVLRGIDLAGDLLPEIVPHGEREASKLDTCCPALSRLCRGEFCARGRLSGRFSSGSTHTAVYAHRPDTGIFLPEQGA